LGPCAGFRGGPPTSESQGNWRRQGKLVPCAVFEATHVGVTRQDRVEAEKWVRCPGFGLAPDSAWTSDEKRRSASVNGRKYGLARLNQRLARSFAHHGRIATKSGKG
jgi:hypothetical protein